MAKIELDIPLEAGGVQMLLRVELMHPPDGQGGKVAGQQTRDFLNNFIESFEAPND